MAEDEKHHRNGLNGMGQMALGVVGLMAVIAGVYAMVAPMNQQIVFQNQKIAGLEATMLRMEERERAGEVDIAKQNERFKEVETQFDAAKDLTASQMQALEQRVTRQEADGNPRHDERIKNLEARVDGQLNGR